MVNVAVTEKLLTVTSTGDYNVAAPLGNVTILGAQQPQNVSFSGGQVQWSFVNNTLLVTGFGNASAWNSNWSLSWS
jgi:hypothetical protein